MVFETIPRKWGFGFWMNMAELGVRLPPWCIAEDSCSPPGLVEKSENIE